ncbi:hypothetical protein [Acidisoma sp. 7E03]
MQRVPLTTQGVITLPNGHPGYQDANLAAGIDGTDVVAAIMNTHQEELAAVVEFDGTVLDPNDNAQLLAAIRRMMRTRIIGGTLNVYVSPAGDDTNAGTTADAPFQTINGALRSVASDYDLTGTQLVINLAAGTYAGCTVDGVQVRSAVSIVGNLSAPGTVTVNGVNAAAVYATHGAIVTVSGFTVTASGTGGDYVTGGLGLYAAIGSSIAIGASMVFAICAVAHISSSLAAYIGPSVVGQGYTVTGGAQYHWTATNGGAVSWADCSMTILNNPNFSQVFAQAVGSGIVNAWSVSFNGAATGIRYYAASFGSIGVHGAGANYLPGNAAGSVDNGLYG